MIKNLQEGMLLYHGSYCEVSEPDIGKCSPFKDFGRGFYLTTERSQAEQFAKLSSRKALENGLIPASQNFGVVSVFKFHASGQTEILVYPEADEKWLHCIVAHRKERIFKDIRYDLAKYDIIGGKIANDATNATILTYMSGAFGEIGSKEADEICIRLLLPERLQDQYAFRTEEALNQLEFLRSGRIWI